MDGAYYSYDLAQKTIKAAIKYMPCELMGKNLLLTK
jgi:hypothetical protein